MTTTTPAPTAWFGPECQMTSKDLRQMADLLDLVGQTVRINDHGRTVIVGTLTSVYWTDGLAVNVTGLIDWTKEGKDYGPDFSCGPLYGAHVFVVKEAWVGLDAEGRATGAFGRQADAQFQRTMDARFGPKEGRQATVRVVPLADYQAMRAEA